MRTPKQWIAGFRWGANSGNGYAAGGVMAPRGTVTLSLELTGSAGVHAGRPVDLVIRPSDLEAMIRLFSAAKAARDGE